MALYDKPSLNPITQDLMRFSYLMANANALIIKEKMPIALYFANQQCSCTGFDLKYNKHLMQTGLGGAVLCNSKGC